MDDVHDFFSGLTDISLWPPRWLCGQWSDFHGWLYILSDIAIWGAYFSIPIAMLWFIIRRKEDIPFVKIFWLFVAFILACGTTHLMDALLFWIPAYRLSGLILMITAIISWTAVIGLIRVVPEAIKLKSPVQYEQIIEERTMELRSSNQNLIKLNRDIDNFVYAASHDLKSPLNNFEGLLTLLRNTVPSQSESNEILKRMELSVSQMQRTITGISEVIKVGMNPLDDIVEITFQDIVDEVRIENESLFKSAKPHVTCDFQVISLNYSRTALKSILYNLMTNACKYKSNYRPLQLTIRTYRASGTTVLEVQDNGIGIDLKLHRKKMFGLFKRFHDHVEGSGLGLFMVRRMIEDRGGSIHVQSEPDQGSIFKVEF